MMRTRFLSLTAAGAVVAATLAISGCASTAADADSPQEAHAPELAMEQLRRGLAMLDEGKSDAAIEALRQAASSDPRSGIIRNALGVAYYRQRLFYDAAQQFQEAAHLLSRRPEPLINLGLVFEAIGDLEQAIDRYEQAHTLAPDRLEVVQNLARARIRRGDRGQDIRTLLLRLTTDQTDARWSNWANEQLTRLGA